MKKQYKKENLHRDYKPIKVLDIAKSTILRGAVILVRFRKVNNYTPWETILLMLFITRVQNVYYWLPYRNVVEASMKYSVLGPSSRFPYSMQWFEVKETNEIYKKKGLSDFIFKQQQDCQKATGNYLFNPFPTNDLLPLTRKSVIKMLDEKLFESKQQQKQITK